MNKNSSFLITVLTIGLFSSVKSSVECSDAIKPFEKEYECTGSYRIDGDYYSTSFEIKKKTPGINEFAILKETECTGNISKDRLTKEFNTANKLDHKNVRKYLHKTVKTITKTHFWEKPSTHCLTIMEKTKEAYPFDYQNAMKAKKKLNDEQQLDLFFQIVRGVNAIHKQGIIHGFLCLWNIVVNDKNEFKITDFELSYNGPTLTTKLTGSQCFIDPALLVENAKFQYDYTVDVYALGVIYYLLQFDNFPFDGYKQNWIDLIKSGDYDLPESKVEIAYLVFHLMNYSPKNRPSIEETLEWIVFIYRNIKIRQADGQLSRQKINKKTEWNPVFYKQMGIKTKMTKFISLKKSKLLNRDPYLDDFLNKHSQNGKIDWDGFELKDVTMKTENESQPNFEKMTDEGEEIKDEETDSSKTIERNLFQKESSLSIRNFFQLEQEQDRLKNMVI